MGSFLGPKDWTWLLLIRWRKSQASHVPRDQQPTPPVPPEGSEPQKDSHLSSLTGLVSRHTGSLQLGGPQLGALPSVGLWGQHWWPLSSVSANTVTALPPEWGWLRDRPYRARKVTPGIRTLNLDHSTPLSPFHLSILSLRSSPCQSSRKSVALFCLKLTAWL